MRRRLIDEHRADDRGLAAHALHRHGLPGLAGRAHRRGGPRPLPARDERGAAGDHLRNKRHTLRRDAAGQRGAGAGPRPRRLRRDEPRGAVQPLLRDARRAGAEPLRGAGRLPLDRRRAHGALAEDTGPGPAVHSPVQRALGLFHRLRAHLEALAGASCGAVRRRGAGGLLPGAKPGGGHRAELRGRMRGRDGRGRALACADAALLRPRPAQARLARGRQRASSRSGCCTRPFHSPSAPTRAARSPRSSTCLSRGASAAAASPRTRPWPATA